MRFAALARRESIEWSSCSVVNGYPNIITGLWHDLNGSEADTQSVGKLTIISPKP